MPTRTQDASETVEQRTPPRPLPAIAGQTVSANGLDASRATIGVEQAWAKGYSGKGVTVAVLDSGLTPHPDIKDRIIGWMDIADHKPQMWDHWGHGTHDAGTIAGSGARSGGRFKGIAPGANIVGVRITDLPSPIEGLNWIVANKEKYNIRVVNISLGDTPHGPAKDDPWAQAAERAIEAGLVVVIAAANDGPSPGTIETPGYLPRAITVGNLDDKHTISHDDDSVALDSSRGPTAFDNVTKPDIVAPGHEIYSPLAPGSHEDKPDKPHIGRDYIALDGTSMSTAMVSGVVALMLEANPALSHDEVKKILMDTADHYLVADANTQGAGTVNAARAVEVAAGTRHRP